MQTTAYFHFYGALNDFLPVTKRDIFIPYAFTDHPSVKDAIEALGVPHPEVDVIVANAQPVNFSYSLHHNDKIEVFPLLKDSRFPESYSLMRKINFDVKFIADVHVGKLAKALRILGFDTVYENNYPKPALVKQAAAENRIILTRDVGLLKNKLITHGYWLRSQNPDSQIMEVLRYFDLFTHIQPFKRCLVCNGLLEKVAKEAVLGYLPPKTQQYFHEFFQCMLCKRVYWKGSHYDRMLQFIDQIIHN